MAKRIFRREDEGRTELLGQAELFVQKGKGSDTYYNAWLHDPEIEYCPRCRSDAVKTQDLFSKTYMDLVSDGEKKKVMHHYWRRQLLIFILSICISRCFRRLLKASNVLMHPRLKMNRRRCNDGR